MTDIQIADLIIGIVLVAAVFALTIVMFRKKLLWLIFGVELTGFSVCYNLQMTYAGFSFLALFVITLIVACFANIGDFRYYVANPIGTSMKKGVRGGRIIVKKDTDYDREKLNKSITQAVKWLSDSRTGALITFERNSSLSKYEESGTVLNAPVTPELIETIFFEGTRLHDGAIIIKEDIIVAASCFFPATTRTLIGKYGARHRAALGISEITDSITVVVSEETGRISIAYNGTMEPVKYDEFAKVFATFMLAPSGTITASTLSKIEMGDLKSKD